MPASAPMFAASFVPAWHLSGAGVGMTSATRVTGTGSGLGGSGGSGGGTWSAWKPLLALGIAKCGRSRGRAARGLQALAEVVEISAEVGLGLVSPQGAKAGAVLIEEDPLLQTSKDERLPESAARFRTLPQGTKQNLLALAATPGQAEKEVGFSGDELRFVRVLRTNSVSVPGAGGAVYKTACRANHSCRPNASLCVGPDARMRLKALRDIEPGEEAGRAGFGFQSSQLPQALALGLRRQHVWFFAVSVAPESLQDIQVSYIGEGDLLRPTQHRQKQLASWGFKCGCVRCSGPEDTRAFTCAACGTGLMHYEKSEAGGTRREHGSFFLRMHLGQFQNHLRHLIQRISLCKANPLEKELAVDLLPSILFSFFFFLGGGCNAATADIRHTHTHTAICIAYETCWLVTFPPRDLPLLQLTAVHAKTAWLPSRCTPQCKLRLWTDSP